VKRLAQVLKEKKMGLSLYVICNPIASNFCYGVMQKRTDTLQMGKKKLYFGLLGLALKVHRRLVKLIQESGKARKQISLHAWRYVDELYSFDGQMGG
jgi:hypothetical protein